MENACVRTAHTLHTGYGLLRLLLVGRALMPDTIRTQVTVGHKCPTYGCLRRLNESSYEKTEIKILQWIEK